MNKQKLVLPICVIMGCIILGGFYYLTQINKYKFINEYQQEGIKVGTSQKEEVKNSKNDDYFLKKIECEKYKEKIKKDINDYNYSQKMFIGDSAVPGNPVSPEIPRLYLYNKEFKEVFYSPKVNSCLYYEVSRTFIAPPEESVNYPNIKWGVSFESHNLIDHLQEITIETEYSVYRSEDRVPSWEIVKNFNNYK